MSLGTLLALAVALAMDAFAVAVASGVTLRTVNRRQTFRLAWHFGLFQGLMPWVGWALGRTFYTVVEAVDHWLAFGLLSAVGIHMLWTAFRPKGPGARVDPTRGTAMVMLSLATSLDALAVGLSLSILGVSIGWPSLVIGLVAALFTAAGLHLGRLLGSAPRLGRWAVCGGGLILLALGVRILMQHGIF